MLFYCCIKCSECVYMWANITSHYYLSDYGVFCYMPALPLIQPVPYGWTFTFCCYKKWCAEHP